MSSARIAHTTSNTSWFRHHTQEVRSNPKSRRIDNISRILTLLPIYEDARSQRPYNTTLPLANSLGITIDHPCDYDDPSCAGKAALKYTGPGNVLIAWEHVYLPKVAAAIGAKDAPSYPSKFIRYIPFLSQLTSFDCR